MPCPDGTDQYAVVAYVQSKLGEFVEELRRELHPPQAHLPTHITVLPPRPLRGTEAEALTMLQEKGASVAPFNVELGEVESFLPITPTVFIRVSHAGYRMRELHDLFNRGGLQFTEALPYMPHVTVAKLESNERAEEVLRTSKARWERFEGSHSILVERLTFVRGRDHRWIDLAEIHLSAPRK
jgi:2'-5' RNA ligase